MARERRSIGHVCILLLATALPAAAQDMRAPAATVVEPNRMPRMATIDERFQSYNVELAELTGGAFWLPYERLAQAEKAQAATGGAAAGGGYGALKAPMPPIDLTNQRLRKLAAALGPAYVRSSGNVADAVYFHDSDTPPPEKPPAGFEAVLTREQWRALFDFAKAVDARVVTSFATSPGTRDADGRWTVREARKLVRYTKSIGGDIAAAEWTNEPSAAPQGVGALPKGYDAQAFARDHATFVDFARKEAPRMRIIGPSAIGEGPVALFGTGELTTTEAIFAATPKAVLDGFSYHVYGASSVRCNTPGKVNTSTEQALTEEWLSRAEREHAFYAKLRDRHLPGKPIWLTEIGEAACGGNPWAKTFLDAFRYVDTLGRLARHGVHTVMHNTLAVSEYALIDNETWGPRPSYWAAILWRRLMGTTVLDSRIPLREGLHLYAHCLRGRPGGVVLLAINNSRDRAEAFEMPMPAQRYTLSASEAHAEAVALNGRRLETASNGDLPPLQAEQIQTGRVELAPLTITFLAVPEAGNKACR
jgi:heparanase